MKKISVEVELTNGERHTLTSKFRKKTKGDSKGFFNLDKEILSVILDRVKESILGTDISIENLKSIHFSICETQGE